jgi:hypothetical protein
VAVHRVDIPGASIPAISFVITAIIPLSCHQGNEAVPGVAVPAVKAKPRRSSFPSVIAGHSQLEERTPMLQLNGIVL